MMSIQYDPKNSRHKPYRVRWINCDRRYESLGRFPTFEEASRAEQEHAESVGGRAATNTSWILEQRRNRR